ncbi:MAG: response regulator [Candidatus Omnitrophica bacterium]|nr:response regulator [Candidatus Omnitrophota bacterium]MCB9719974.1 response regulator [Candidatus Omnitrophota bacterium]
MTKSACVAILDDEKSILASLKRLFSRENFAVRVTTDYRDILDWVASGEIKVVVSDHRMPEIRGTELLKQVRDRAPATVRILFTGYADFAAAEEAINIAGVYRFITKPWDNHELLAVIHQAIAQYDRNQQKEDELRNLRTRVQELERRLRK